MHIGHINDVEKEVIPVEGGKGAYIQWLLTKKEGVEAFYMRYVTLEPDGIIPLHTHEQIHEMFIVKGKGASLTEAGEKPVEAGNFIYVESELVHGIKNIGNENLEFICCIDVVE